MVASFLIWRNKMHVYLHFGTLTIPTYGFLIALGVVVANVVAMFVLKQVKQDVNDFIILEAYGFLGAFIGSKLLYLIISYKSINWAKITDIHYANNLMLTGFVFYGGLIMGLLFVFGAGRIHKINAQLYIRNFIFLIPFIHCFGRIGCFMAGCCYGIPYNGIGAVVFPEGSYAIPGIPLFPVQLVEAVCLMIIAIIILYLRMKKNCFYTIETYLILYAMVRFGLEKLRYDSIRGYYAGLSTSQWISILLVIVAIALIGVHRKTNQEK